MFRPLLTNKIALAVVALVPWFVGEVASMQGCACPDKAPPAAEAPAAENASALDCLVYETASGRIVTVKAPVKGAAVSDCVRI